MRSRFWFRHGRGPSGGDSRRPSGCRTSAALPGRVRPTLTARLASGICTCSVTEQPDLNWKSSRCSPRARGHPPLLVRPWRRRGPDRFSGAAREGPQLPDLTEDHVARRPTPTTDRDELHEIYRSWRAIADSYPGTRILIGEVWLPDADRFARYLRPDELHAAFNFDFMARPWEARACGHRSMRPWPLMRRLGPRPTWVYRTTT